MRILLVSPPSGDLTIGLKHLAKVEPLGLEIIGAAVPDHQVELLDMELDTDLIGALQRWFVRWFQGFCERLGPNDRVCFGELADTGFSLNARF